MIKNFLLTLCSLFIIAALSSCDDNNLLGLAIQPDNDKISVTYDTVAVQSKTVFLDSVFLRNSVAALGEFTDPTYGTTKSDFMAQLYCARSFGFPDDVKKIDSAYIYIFYNSWFGDSTQVHHLNVYELDRQKLDVNNTYYSNTNVDDYCSKSKLIAEGSFTTGDVFSSDSIRELDSYTPSVKIPVSKEFAQRFLIDSRLHPEYFKEPKAFQNYFNGIYVTTDYGNGSILYATNVEIELCFDTWLKNKTNGLRDSLVIGGAYFPINKEVKQINRVSHPDLSYYANQSPTDSLDYIFAPAGMFTEVTIPKDIFVKDSGMLSGKKVSGLRLTVSAAQLDEDNNYAMSPPSSLLLLNKADAQDFFQNYELNDGIHSFVANYDSENQTYVFDLSVYAQAMIHKMDGTVGSTTLQNFKPFTDMLLIPVNMVQNTDGDNVRVDHVITPAAVKLKAWNHPHQPMKLEVIYTKSK